MVSWPNIRQARLVSTAAQIVKFDTVDELRDLTVKGPGEDGLFATYQRTSRAKYVVHGQTNITNAYYIGVHLNTFICPNISVDGRSLGPKTVIGGTATVYDWRRQWRPECDEPYETMGFLLPFSRLREFDLEPRNSGFKEIEFPLPLGPDHVMCNLAQAFLPALQRPSEASVLFIEFLFSALAVYLSHRLGPPEPQPKILKGGLALWQERRAKEMLTGDFHSDVSLNELAEACDVSVGHFSRAFKTSTGMAPHRWLLEQRINRARDLMILTDHSLSEIALIAGFGDQSHLTRIFKKALGVSPGAWRRANL